MRTTVNRQPLRFSAAVAIACSLLLAGCASKERTSNTIFDFGPVAPAMQAAAAPKPAAIVVMDVTGPATLDTERMFYRLNYADAQQARTYANSRWSATPVSLVTQRIKARLAQSGMKVLSATDAATGVPILRIEIDDFVHAFASAGQSEGQIMLRASVFQEHRLVDQRSFHRNAPAPSQDAAGGVAALATGTDQVAADLLAWLASLDTQGK
ncbi:ABC transporter [Massilia arenae]|uniref:ABC transporter n=1 Tax=Massilia arenae TaxID=2603288 RepID=A0A5C7FL37_9BURK|nr:ABC transporter [Massilia arenae]